MATTITLGTNTKHRLELLKGDATWDEFLAKIADIYPPDDVLEELSRRLAEIEEGRTKTIAWSKLREELA